MSSPLQFDQVQDNLYVLSTLNDSKLTDYWAGYCASPGTNFGATATTTQVWQDTGGFYLFLSKKPSDWSAFLSELDKLFPVNDLRCLWIDNSSQSSIDWESQALYARSRGSGGSIQWEVLRGSSFVNGMYQLMVNGQSSMTYIDDASGGGFSLSNGGSLNGPNGGYPVTAVKMTFSGTGLGTFGGDISVPASADPSETLWSRLDIGLRYVMDPPGSSDTQSVSAESQEESPDPFTSLSAIQQLDMPVFSGQSDAIQLELRWDPLNALVPDRTFLSLCPGGTAPALTIPSYFRTTKGYEINLQPRVGTDPLPDARFVFGSNPVTNAPDAQKAFHLCPDGTFTMEYTTPSGGSEDSVNVELNQLLLGLSGLEYANINPTTQSMVVFEAGNPAFVEPIETSGTKAPPISEALKGAATTSHLTVMPISSSGVHSKYYAQPKTAPIFASPAGTSLEDTGSVIPFNAMWAFTLNQTAGIKPPVFPVGVYAGLSNDQTQLAQEIENSSLAPYRHYQIGRSYGVGDTEELLSATRRVRTTDDLLGVTPQGLVAELTSDRNDFDGLILGNMPGTAYPTVKLSPITGKFKEALQSNQLFFVASDFTTLMKATSVEYAIDSSDKDFYLAKGISEATFDAVYAIVKDHQPYPTETSFKDAISSTAGGDTDKFVLLAGLLKVEMDDWTFQLSPTSWRTDPKSPTMMIAKFCKRSLIDMINDTSSWAWPEVAESAGSLSPTKQILQNMVAEASDPEANESYKIFYNTVLNNASWNGFLFLNTPVDVTELPDDLKFLVAGIDTKQFYAHHIGFSQTPFDVQNSQPVLKQTAAFGLVDYQDELDLSSDDTIQFGFKTMQLRARFANAALVDFSAQVELMINKMLATSVQKKDAARGNNLIIDGTYQRVGGVPSYAFALTGENLFNGQRSMLTSIEILSVQLINKTKSDNSTDIETSFVLMGNLRFLQDLSFDLFSFGPDNSAGDKSDESFLRFNGISIDMSFSMATPEAQTFIAREADARFDLSHSKARKAGLLNNFPLTIAALISSPNLASADEAPKGQSPEDMGYTSISAPMDQTPMTVDWFGLEFILDMGTFGALSGSVSFKISILAAWSEGASQTDHPAYIGIKLPNISAIGGSFPLQGVLKIGFRSFQFKAYEDDTHGLVYILILKRFVFSALIWSFPPGNADIFLFGQPGNPSASLGWYAAYDSGKSKQASTTPKSLVHAARNDSLSRVKRSHRSGRRNPPIA